ncbi:MAG: hypothetical protein GY719_34945 [bacterium]|nr:hypothetical protein [bacterium]
MAKTKTGAELEQLRRELLEADAGDRRRLLGCVALTLVPFVLLGVPMIWHQVVVIAEFWGWV